jgi:outer membrane protein assembly factor BamB
MCAGCGGLKIPSPLRVDNGDWPTYARVETRSNFTEECVVPPLTLEWESNITGGIGNGSPVIIDSIVFIGNLRGELHAINAFTGKRIGWVDLGDAIQGAPSIRGNFAIVALSNSSESLVAFDLLNGRVLWSRDYGDIEVSPLVLERGIYVGNTAGSFYCVDPEKGEKVWAFEIADNTKLKGIRSSPASDGTTVVFGADDGSVYALDHANGRQCWSVKTTGPIHSAPALRNGTVYVGNIVGDFYALDLHTGAILWKFPAGAAIYASPTVANDLVMLGTAGGTVFGLNAATGSVIWKTAVGSVVNSGGVVSDTVMYVGTLNKELLAIGVRDGSVLWKGDVGGRIKTSPAVAHGKVYVATDERIVMAFHGALP